MMVTMMILKKLGFVERVKNMCLLTPGLLDTVFQFTIRTRKDGGGKNRFGVVDCNRFEDYGRCKSLGSKVDPTCL